MNLFELFVKIGAKDEASEKIKKVSESAEKASKGGLSEFAGKLGSGLATAAKIGTAAIGTAAAGITALTTAAVNNYAEYEQLVGGVQTLFGAGGQSLEEYAKSTGKSVDEVKGEYDKLIRSQEAVISNADRAYRTAGMSVNEYMSTVTSFSASLLQGLGGDTEKAAKIADKAITDMSDNANKMGTSIEMIQNAYQGFAKQNYTMLDNLKLGYGGTAGEMARLINDSGVLGKEIKVEAKTVNSVSFDKIIEAIGVMQDRMGITGTTAKEAGATIAGSVGAMKSAWTNLITGLADGNADVGKLIDNLVTTIVGDGTENNLGVIGNVLPAIETALGGAVKLIEGAAPKIIEILPGLVTRIVPSLISAATNMVDAVIKVVPDLLNTVVTALVDNAPALITAAIGLVQSLIQGIQDNYQILVDGAIQIVSQLATGILNMLPQIIALGLDLIISLANGIATSLPALIPTIIDVMMKIVDTLTQPETLSNLLDATLAIILALADGLVQFIPALIDATITLIDRLIVFLLEPENIQKLAEAAVKIVVALAEGLIKSVGTLMGSTGELISNVVDKFKETDWLKIGKDIVNGILDGLKKTWDDLSGWFTDKWDGLVGGVKDLLGIHSPSRVFAGIGRNMALGVGEGWEDEFGDIQNDIDKSLAFDDPSMSLNASIRRVGAGAAGGAFGGNSIGSITIKIDGAKYSDEQSLAEAVAEAIQNMTDRRAAVYA